MKTSLSLFAVFLFAGRCAFGQTAVNDAGTQALLSKQNNDFLNQMTTELGKFDQQISQFTTIINQGNQALQTAGNPAQALSFAGGSTGLDPSVITAANGLFKTAGQIGSAVDGTRSLANNSQGVFQAIPSQLSDGTSILRNTSSYNKFDAFEQNVGNFQNVLTQAQSNRSSLLTQLKTVMNTPANTVAEQSEKQSRIEGLSAQIYANDQAIRDAHEQRQSQAEANAQDAAKQAQAEQEQENTEGTQAQNEAASAMQSALQSP